MVRRPSEEQDQLRHTVRSFLEERAPQSRVRAVMETGNGHDKGIWEQLAGELGLAGLLVPEEFGGAGASVAEAAIVLEELGRGLTCVPYLSSAVLAATLLRRSGDESAWSDYLPGIADGSTIATVAIAESPATWGHDGERLNTVAVSAAGGWRLRGHKVYVLDAAAADLLLVVADTRSGVGTFAVASGADGLVVDTVPTTDATRPLATVTFTEVPARRIGAGPGDESRGEPVADLLDIAAVALAAEDVGGALRLCELAAGYAGIREQFGRVIGANQAIKQKLADLVASVELARAAARRVADAATVDRPALPLEASMAKALCSDTFVQAAYATIQVHGGIGFTWEHPAHLYLRRALGNAQLFGSPDRHRELAVRRLLR